jgi:PAS domain S-box-containing protein
MRIINKRLSRILELLDFYSDTFSRISLLSCDGIGDIAVNIISSLLNYRIAILMIGSEQRGIEALSHKGISQQSISSLNSSKGLSAYLWKNIDAPDIINCKHLDETILNTPLRSDLGEMFLVVPLKTLVQNQEKIIGFALAANPCKDHHKDIDIKALDIITSLVTGAILNCRMRKNITSTNYALKLEISERIRAEQERRKSEMQKQAILDASVDMIVYVDKQMRIIWANKQAAAVVNTTPDKLIGQTCHRYFQNSDIPCQDCPCKRALETGKVEHGIKYQPAMNVVGESYWEDYGIPLRNEDGEVVGLIEIARNVTDKIKSEIALRESRELYKTIFENTGNATVIIEDDMKIALANSEFEKLSGYSKDEIEGKKTFTEYFAEEDVEHVKEFHYFRRTDPHGAPQKYEINFIDNTGNIKNVIIYVAIIPGTTKSVASLIDITEQKLLKDQLYHAQKMEAIGQLAGGVAHDFNNILTTIIGYTNFMQMKMDHDHPFKMYVDNILTAANRAAHLTKDLLAFSRKQIMHLEPLSLNDIVISIEKLISRVIGEDIEMSIILTAKALPVMADQGQIEQVLMNLITNARDAMLNGGSLLIKTDSLNIESEFLKLHGYGRPGLYACISVVDTGIGMDDKIKARIFEPFFTTKEVGKGTGLGLSMAYGIVKQHDGYINVYSDPCVGTTFKVYLPMIRSGFEREPQEIDPAMLLRGTETVLLAEDDERVRSLLKSIIEKYGYNVIEASDGRDAVDKFNENNDKIQLLIFDLVMPEKNGKEAFENIYNTKPEIRTIFMSGYAEEFIKKMEFVGSVAKFISKPVSPVELLQTMREVLDNNR